MSRLEDLSTRFRTAHPTVGEFSSPGGQMSPEQARAFGDIVKARITELTRKESLTSEEMTFIDKVADLGSRNISWLLQKGLSAPKDSPSVRAMLSNAIVIIETVGGGKDAAGRITPKSGDPIDIDKIVGQMTGGSVGMREAPELRGKMEEYASAVVTLFGEVADENGSIPVDNYLQGNLDNIVAHYEIVEAQTSQAI